MDKVSVIIPTYNRFKYLLNAIESVKKQTYPNIEIIVVNDCSTQEDYYTFDFKKEFGEEFYIIHLPKNSRKTFGNVCGGGNSRNIGMMIASGTYIAFLDDDDSFLPNKIEKQVQAMIETNCSFSCTEGYGGKNAYKEDQKYRTWHFNGIYWNSLKSIFKNKTRLFENMFKNEVNVWNADAINTHNCILCSSSMIKKDLINKAGYFPLRHYAEDWAYWKEIIKHTNCAFIREPLTYIDLGHGDGRNY